MEIKEFLQQPEVQHLLEETNLEGIYEMLSKLGRMEITSFFLSNNINPLDYLTSIPHFMYYKVNVENVDIPNNVTNIGRCAFENCSSLTSVTIGNNITSIGDYAFAYCEKLKYITVPNSVTTIGDWAFKDCFSLTNVTLGDKVKSIGISAFTGCFNLTNITIPDSVTNIGDFAFCECSDLTIRCQEGSYAHKYAIERNFNYELI